MWRRRLALPGPAGLARGSAATAEPASQAALPGASYLVPSLLSSGGRGRPSQLVELAEHFVDDGFHFISDDGQSEHRLASFT